MQKCMDHTIRHVTTAKVGFFYRNFHEQWTSLNHFYIRSSSADIQFSMTLCNIRNDRACSNHFYLLNISHFQTCCERYKQPMFHWHKWNLVNWVHGLDDVRRVQGLSPVSSVAHTGAGIINTVWQNVLVSHHSFKLCQLQWFSSTASILNVLVSINSDEWQTICSTNDSIISTFYIRSHFFFLSSHRYA